MGSRIMRRHIWGYSVCLCPIKRTPGLYHSRLKWSWSPISNGSHRNMTGKSLSQKTIEQANNLPWAAASADKYPFFRPLFRSMPLLTKSRFQASNNFLWLNRPLCVRHGWKPRRPLFLPLFLPCGSYLIVYVYRLLMVRPETWNRNENSSKRRYWISRWVSQIL